jgi:hypothetical protein
MVDQTYTLEGCDCNEALLEGGPWGGHILYLFFSEFITDTVYRVVV